MADDKDVNATNNPDKETSALRKSLPPLKSGVGTGAKAPLPPLRSGGARSGTENAPPSPRFGSQQSGGASPETSSPQVATPLQVTQKPATVPRNVKPKQDKPPENDQGVWRMNRKNFLNVAGWFAFFSFLATATLGAIRLMVPRVLYEQPSAFKAGFPSDFVIGEVNEKYKDEYRVWIVREVEGFYALLAICTHLGCTPRWLATENKFKCPCHGSGYHKDGINFEGPTPRPLERLKITLADDGEILIDRAVKFRYEKGEWSKPDAFLKYT